MGYVISKFDRPVSARLLVNTGTSGCSTGSLLCGVPLNISEGVRRPVDAGQTPTEAERRQGEVWYTTNC